MKRVPAIVVVATAWGSKFGGVNSFSTDLCRALAQTLTVHRLVCVCMEAPDVDREEARKVGVNLLPVPSKAGGRVGREIAAAVVDAVKLAEIGAVEWWVGHDSITGAVALACKELWKGSKAAVVMHMSYQDYAYVKHGPEDAKEIAARTELQQEVLGSADVGLAVGPLLFDRLKTIRGGMESCHMLVPGLADLADKQATEERLHAITFGRFDDSESVVKQAPLAVAAFARAFKIGVDSSSGVWKNARLRLIGAPTDVTAKLRALANSEAGRLVNLEAHEFIGDGAKLRTLLHECNVCLMLSWHEGFGLSGWEAIGAGVPLILSANSGLYQLLDSLGGAATGCVLKVDVKGRGDGEPNEADIESAARTILAVAGDITKARADAKVLRSLLRFTHKYTWTRTARDFALALGLPVTTSILDLVGEPRSGGPAGAEDVFGSAELATAERVLALADSNYQCGQYHQALEAIESLKRYDCLRDAPEVALDAVTKEAQVYMRLNRYQPAIALVRQVAQEARDRADWTRYVRARRVENVILRDQGNYSAATKLARDLLATAEHKCKPMIESVSRALARCLALSGLCDEAVEHATKAHEMAKGREDRTAQAKAALALGEAYRHGRNDEAAVKWYSEASDLSARAGNVDCFLWALLGLSDCAFLKGDLSSCGQTLKRLKEFMERGMHTHPLESLHVRLSLLSISVVKGEPVEADLKSLLSDYDALGIRWPVEYFEAIKKRGAQVPKRF